MNINGDLKSQMTKIFKKFLSLHKVFLNAEKIDWHQYYVFLTTRMIVLSLPLILDYI